MRPRLALFTSHVHGEWMVRSLAADDRFQIVLISSDDPHSAYSNARVRLWRYWFDSDDELDRLARLVPDTAAEFGITAFTGRVRPENGVFRTLVATIRPDAIVTSVYGQRLPAWLLDDVDGRAWNVHNVVPGFGLADFAGPQPIEKALALGASSIQMIMHRMGEAYDDGPEVGRSEPYPLPRIGELDAKQMMMIQEGTAPLGAALVKTHLPALLAM